MNAPLSSNRLSTERIRLLIKHYSDELPDHHALYTEDYRLAEQDTVAALHELLGARSLLAEARAALVERMTPDERARAEEVGLT